MEKTYWNRTGTHQDLVEQLNKLIPVSGGVEKPWKNKALERFRKASNAYYDIFNNGGINRGRSIGKIFQGAMYYLSYHYGVRKELGRINWDRIHQIAEPKMDAIILEAAKEQGLVD
jgi:hypothetical protein